MWISPDLQLFHIWKKTKIIGMDDVGYWEYVNSLPKSPYVTLKSNI